MASGLATGRTPFDHPWFRALWLGYWITLFALTHSPKLGWPGWAPQPSDKNLHLVAYFLLAAGGWLVLSVRPDTGRPSAVSDRWRPVDWFCVVVVYGACDEVLQVPCGRFCSILDLAADATGAAIAIAVIELVRAGRRTLSAGRGDDVPRT